MIKVNNVVSKTLIKYFYLFGVLMMMFGLMFSFFFASISIAWLLFTWILEGDFKNKFKENLKDWALIIFVCIFFVYLLGILWTNNFEFGFADLLIKTSILVLPIVLKSKFWLDYKIFISIIYIFLIFVFLKSIQYLIFFVFKINTTESIFYPQMSHILYSIIINIAIVFSLFIIRTHKNIWIKILLVFYILWFTAIIIYIQSLTGVAVLLVFMVILNFYSFFSKQNIVFSLVFLVFSLTIFILFLKITINEYNLYFNVKPINYSQLQKQTVNGNYYVHDTTEKWIEEGRYVFLYVSEYELRKEWTKRSKIDFDNGLDSNGFFVKYTLYRYMTSKGLTKDSLGLWQMTNLDIKNVEKGYTNYRFSNKFTFSGWFNKIFWQFYNYETTKNPNDQSISQRIEYIKTSRFIFKNNWLLGVGTGDIRDEFNIYFEKMNSKLEKQNRKYVHNQMLTFILTFGAFLGIFCIFALFFPYFKNKKYKELMPTLFFVAFILFCFAENAFDRTQSTIFTVFFYSLLIINKNIFYDKSTTA